MSSVSARQEIDIPLDFWLSQRLSSKGVLAHFRSSPACQCGHPSETVDHVLTECVRYAADRPALPLNISDPVHQQYIRTVVLNDLCVR